MRTRIERSGTVRVPLPPEEAFPLFTPEGERAWVDDWSPAYPEGGRPRLARGLVFEVGKEDGGSTWIVACLDTVEHSVSYVYVLPGHRAVLVEVRVEGEGGESVVGVTYHMTALSPKGDAFVEEFGNGYEAFLESWQEAIRRHLTPATTE